MHEHLLLTILLKIDNEQVTQSVFNGPLQVLQVGSHLKHNAIPIE
jgi:hypothetical protein